MGVQVYTIGHSTRAIDEFISLLKTYRIARVVDIRTIPKSRHNPQFGQEELSGSLTAEHIGYTRVAALGGLRRTTAASPNTAWRNASFRGYADHMQTQEFADGIAELRELAAAETVAIMCAEAVPWRCHRSLVGDALLVRGDEVLDIMSETNVRPHTLTSFAHVDGTTITYPPSD